MKKIVSDVLDWMKTIVVSFIIVTLIRQFIFSPTLVEGSSMYSTLHDGDYVMVWEMLYQPEMFDVVVFEYSETEHFVKRIVGLPGQQVKYVDDQLYIDGIAVEEPFLLHSKKEIANQSRFDWDWESGVFTNNFTLDEICLLNGFEICDVIPEGYYLVLGDNRPLSKDSRDIGLVNEDKIIGKVVWVHFPISRFGSLR